MLVAPHNPSQGVRALEIESGTPDQLVRQLNDLERKGAPERLWTLGDRGLLKAGPKVAVVGSRNASARELEEARYVTHELVGVGAVVVSGLALGIDTVAHENAIEAGGRTIAVLGTGIDIAYPTQNRRLQARIGADHLLVSQFPPGSRPTRTTFPQRNRTMALLSDATIVVAATEKSGTRHQAFEALRIGRTVLILESLLSNAELEWPHEALRYGAQPLAKESVPFVVSRLGHLTVDLDIWA